MTWNNELAFLASLNTKQCQMKHDKCRNTEKFQFAGQNLAIRSTTGFLPTEMIIDRTLMSWFNEYKKANFDNIQEVGSPANG